MIIKYDLELEPFDENIYDEFIDTHSHLKKILSGKPVVEWKSYIKELKEFSKKYVDTVFSLYGEPENAVSWVQHFWRGLSYREEGEDIYKEFDLNKLQKTT